MRRTEHLQQSRLASEVILQDATELDQVTCAVQTVLVNQTQALDPLAGPCYTDSQGCFLGRPVPSEADRPTSFSATTPKQDVLAPNGSKAVARTRFWWLSQPLPVAPKRSTADTRHLRGFHHSSLAQQHRCLWCKCFGIEGGSSLGWNKRPTMFDR